MENISRRIETLSPAKRRLLQQRLREQSASAAEPTPGEFIPDPCPASFAQQRLWFLHRYHDGHHLHNTTSAIHLHGPLDLDAFRRCVAIVLNRHEVYRLCFSEQAGEPTLVLATPNEPELPLVEFTDAPADERRVQFDQRMSAQTEKPFDLAQAPLARLELIRLSTHHHVLVHTAHHTISDRWSIGVLIRDLARCYEAVLVDRAPDLPPLPLSYRAYAARQRRALGGDELRQQFSWWRDHLGDALPVLDLPLDHTRPPEQTFAGARRSTLLPHDLVSQLTALGQRHNASLFAVLLSAYAVLLRRYSGQSSVIVGVPVAGRTQADTQDMAGLFLNHLPIRVDLNPAEPFTQLLQRVSRIVISAMAHQDVPFDRLISELDIARDRSRPALAQTCFNFLNVPLPTSEAGGVRMEYERHHAGTSEFDLMLEMRPVDAGMLTELEYSTDLFEADRIEGMLRHFRFLLRSIVNQPKIKVHEARLLDRAERQRLLIDFSPDSPHPSRGHCLHELFERQAAIFPQRGAVLTETQALTYQQLNERANRVAHLLIAHGIQPGDLVSLCMGRHADLIASVLGVLKTGAAYVPLDPTHPTQRLRHIVENSMAPLILADKRHVDRLPSAAARVLVLDQNSDTLASQPATNPTRPVSDDQLAYVLYTSGSTGEPKGVAVPHRGPVALVDWACSTVPADQLAGMLFSSSLCFDLSVFEIFVPLSAGGRIVVAADALGLVDMRSELKRAITFVNTVPSAMGQLLQLEALPPQVRAIAMAGEALPAAVAEGCLALASKPVLYNLYGPTEDTVYSTVAIIDACNAANPPIGRPLGGSRAYVLDADGQCCPIGVPGELHLGGCKLAHGYHRRPDLTADRFVPDPFSGQPGARMYRTGDLCRWRADGSLAFVNRLDHQIKLRGFRIEPGEIECSLVEHPDVQRAIVVLREDGTEAELVGYVQRRPGRHIDPDSLNQHLKTRVPSHMLPQAYVVLENFPMTPNGKVDRRALPRPGHAATEGIQQHASPETPTQEIICRLFADVLGVERVGIDDDFFDLGGHSLRVTMLLFRIQRALNTKLPLSSVFDHPTPRQIADLVDANMMGPTTPPPRVQHDRQSAPLTEGQRGLWFLEQLDPGTASYNVPIARRLTGPLDPARLQQAIEQAARRHDALRVRIQDRDGEPTQVLTAPDERVLTPALIDLSDQPAEQREAALVEVLSREGARTFDLEHGPLARCCLIRISATDHTLLLVMHHLICDEWSIDVLLRDIGSAYRNFLPEAPAPSFLAHVASADGVEESVLDRDLAWWQRQWKQPPNPIAWPADYPRPAQATVQGGRVAFEIDAELAAAVRDLGRSQQLTPYMTLLAGWAVLLRRVTGQADLAIGTPVLGRDDPAAECIFGYFTNTLPLRLQIPGDPTFKNVMATARRVSLEAFDHASVPLPRLIQAVSPERSLRAAPLFQVMFQFESAGGAKLDLPGVICEPQIVDNGTSKLDLYCSLLDVGDTMRGFIEYSADLFDRVTIERLSETFTKLLEAAVTAPDQPVSRLDLLPGSQRQLVIDTLNDTDAPRPGAAIHALFQQQANQTPEVVAVLENQQRWTYRQLNRRANQLAHHLRQRGVSAGDFVAVGLPRSADFVISVLAILKAGAAYVPLDLEYPAERIAYMLQDTGARAIVTREPLTQAIPDADVDRILMDRDAEAIERCSTDDPDVAVNIGDPAYVVYTSGSTGRPKGVVVPHRGVVRLVFNQSYAPMNAHERYLLLAPVSFDASTFELWAPLLHGGRLVVYPHAAPVPMALKQTIQEHGITCLWLTAALFNAIVDDAPDSLANVSHLLIGGEALSVPHVRRALDHLPRTSIINGYGPTENTTFTCTHPIPRDLPDDAGSIPIGRPIANTQVYILDEALRPVPAGMVGELCIGGDGLAIGYLNDPDLTRERFITAPFLPADRSRLYRSGDLARLRPDGTIEFLGRVDDQVKIRGHRIEPGEITATLTRFEDIQQAAVVARPHAAGERHLVAYVVATPGAAVTTEDLKNRLKQLLPDYMLPTLIVALNQLPLGPTGKVDRSRLPEPRPASATRQAAEPVTPTEARLLRIWQTLLNRNDVATTDNFFDVGGHSLMAVRLFAAIEQEFGHHLRIATLFHAPTIRQLAEVIDRQARPAMDDPCLIPLRPAGRGVPMLVLSGLGGQAISLKRLIDGLAPDRPCYGLEPPGMDARAKPLATVPEIAAFLNERVRMVTGDGPCCLVGYSFGGVLAYEMARQLRDAGSPVESLLLIDAYLPGSVRPRHAVERLAIHARRFRDAPTRAKAAYLGKQLLYRLRGRRPDTPGHDGSSRTEHELYHLQQIHQRAYERYEAQPCDAQGHVFVRTEWPQWREFFTGPGEMMWARFLRGGVTLHDVPGDHLSLLREPHVHRLVEAMNACLTSGPKDA